MENIILNKTKAWWQPKAGLILSAVYFSILLNEISFNNSFLFVFPAIITILGIGLLGHLINDFFDKTADSKVGKKNILANVSLSKTVLLFVGAASLALLPWLVLPKTIYTLYFLLAEFILLLLYALPLIRVKERGFLALIFDSLYAYVLPCFLAYYTFSLLSIHSVSFIWVGLSAFFWLLFSGIYNLAIHQLEDYENDLQSNTKTWVTKFGKEISQKFTLQVIFSLQLFFFFTTTILLLLIEPYISIALFVAFSIKLMLILLNQANIYLHFNNKNINYLQLINFHYHNWLPYIFLIFLCFLDPFFLLILSIHYLLFHYKSIIWVYKKHLKQILSFTVNYLIYYLRRLTGSSIEQAMKAHYQEYLVRKMDLEERKSKINIVIANTNKDKYTETFVANHRLFLKEKYYVHNLYGGSLPIADFKRGLLTSNSSWVRKWLSFKDDYFEKGESHSVQQGFLKFLIVNNIQLVIAEFGTVGVEVYELCKQAKVPLHVVFYGYDAHHLSFSAKTNKRYQGLFDYASTIICVSKEIQQTLAKHGAPTEKLVYLPCALDLEKFPYSDHSKNPPIFLSVGRFAETKSPHLSILAFNEVLKEIPKARFRMIGKDGGGELFEACHILVKALKIENSVDFLGILPPEKVYEEMKNARVFVQHSVTTPIHEDKEGTPVSVMEAMTCGLPVVATKHAGIAELIDSGKNGVLVEEYDYLSMAKEMIRVCKSDELVNFLGKNAAESIRNNDLIAKNKMYFQNLF